MAIFSSTQPSLRARILPRFPAQVIAGNGIAITREGGKYTFAVSALVDVPLASLQAIPPNTVVGNDGAVAAPPKALTVGGGLSFTGAGGIQLSQNQRSRSHSCQFTPPVANAFQDLLIPLACTITRVTMLASVPGGSAVLNLWKSSYANYPPTAANSIVATAKPTLALTVKQQDSILTGWTKSINANDVIRVVVESASALTYLAFSIDVETV